MGSTTASEHHCCVLVESKDIEIVVDDGGQASILGREFLGDLWEYRVRMGDLIVRATCPVERDYPLHTPCNIKVKSGASVDLMAS